MTVLLWVSRWGDSLRMSSIRRGKRFCEVNSSLWSPNSYVQQHKMRGIAMDTFCHLPSQQNVISLSLPYFSCLVTWLGGIYRASEATYMVSPCAQFHNELLQNQFRHPLLILACSASLTSPGYPWAQIWALKFQEMGCS